MASGLRAAAAAVTMGGALLLSSCTVDDLFTTSGAVTGSTEDKVVMGLKTALEVGIDSSAAAASRIDGYLARKAIKILLPPEAGQALEAAGQVGALVKPFAAELSAMQSLVDFSTGTDKSSFTTNLGRSNSLLSEVAALDGIGDSVIKYMNRAAEYAAPRSGPIFRNAITGMTISDGLSLLNGSDSTAATLYLQEKTYSPLVTAYAPLVDSTLDLVPLTRYWGDFRSAYNEVLSDYNSLLAFQEAWNGNVIVANVSALQIDGLKKVSYKPIATESLGAWTTQKALDGLFYLVGEEEKKVRRDPWSYVENLASELADLLGEVFGRIMKMES
jgi:hypothetical protein